MSFPPAFLDELRSRLSLSDVIGKRIRLTRAGREFKACCPFHNEKSPSFYINDDKQFFHCFGCGAHGDIIGFTMRHDRLSFPEAIESLAGMAGLPVPRDTPVEREKFDQEKRFYQIMERASAWFEEQLFAPVGREAMAYLRKRGLSEEAVRRFQLGYAPNDGQALIKKLTGEGFKLDEMLSLGLVKRNEERGEHYSFFRNRVMFPVGDRRGRTVAFGGRVMGDGEPKYLNSPDHPLFHKGKLLYGLSRARAAIGQGQPIIVVEGYMDVIALVEAGFGGAVAPLGTALTEDQIKEVWKCLPPLESRNNAVNYDPILCFDGDNAGLFSAERAVNRILPLATSTQTIRIAILDLKDAKDPDDLIRKSGKAAMDIVLKEAKPLIDIIWKLAWVKFGRSLKTPEEQSAFRVGLRHYVNLIADPSLRKLYEDEINKRLQEEKDRIWKEGQKQRSQKSANSTYRRGSYGQGRYGDDTPPFLSRRQPTDARRLREKTLLALILNHPLLFNDFGEDLARVGFETPAFESLRQRIIDILSLDSHEPLDANELYRHLSTGDESGFNTESYAESLAEILSESTYIHAGFARPDRTIDQARFGWKAVWNKHLQEQLQADLQNASRLYAENASDENLARLMALRTQIESMMADMSGEGVSESA